jgi:RimJ/RimL family protein N-acetyltransferase
VRRADETLDFDGGWLRRYLPADLEPALRSVRESLEHLKPWMAWATDEYGEEEASAFLDRCRAEWEAGEAFHYAVLAADGEMIGSCGLMARPGAGPDGMEIGYWLHPGHTGRGLMTRAAAALTVEALRIGADPVELVHDVANERSGAVAHRLGFTYVGNRPAEDPLAPAQTGVMALWRVTPGWRPPADLRG